MRASVDLLDGRGFNLTTLVLAVIAILLAVVSVYYARRALFPPKRRLSYCVESSSPLVQGAGHLAGAIEVSREGVPLSDPHVVVLWLKNTGRHAIASEHFDQGRPVELDLSAQIVDLVTAGGSAQASCAVHGAVIAYGPELLSKGQKVTFTALVDGAPDFSLRQHLIDVEVKAAPDPERMAPVSTAASTMAAAASFLAAIVTLLR